jgi:hypothetical protein
MCGVSQTRKEAGKRQRANTEVPGTEPVSFGSWTVTPPGDGDGDSAHLKTVTEEQGTRTPAFLLGSSAAVMKAASREIRRDWRNSPST